MTVLHLTTATVQNGGHNGGLSQVNLNFMGIGGEYPFMNQVKSGQYWSFITNPSPTAPVDPSTLDDDGYPTSITNGGVYTRTYIPTQTARPGRWRVKWHGIGTVYCPNATSLHTGSKTSTTITNGEFTFTPNTPILDIGISAIGATRVTDLSLVHEDDATAYDAGAVFTQYFKDKIVEGGFGVLRFMNWQQSNLCQASTWWTRRAASCVHYTSGEYRPSIYCGTTSGNGGVYTASAPAMSSAIGAAWDGVLRDKTTVSVIFNRSASATVSAAVSSGANTVLTIATGAADAQFSVVGESVIISGVTGAWAGLNGTWTTTAASAGSVTVNFDSSALTPGGIAGTVLLYHTLCSLNVGGTGAKNILSMYCQPLVGSSHAPIGQTYQSLATLVYDAAMGAWIKRGGDGSVGNSGLNNGVPPELLLQLCEEVGAHPYVMAPHYALAPVTDFMENMAEYYRDNAPSWMVPRYEGPNEQWNGFSGFTSRYYSQARQGIWNGVKFSSGIETNTTYTVSAMTYPVNVAGAAWTSGQKYMKMTVSTAGNTFLKGSRLTCGGTWGGITPSMTNTTVYVTGINIGADPNVFTAYAVSGSNPEGVPTSGTYTSGGTVVPNAGDYHNWYGQAISELGQIISTVYAADRAKYQVICGVQTGTGDTSGNLLNSVPRMTALSYVLRVAPTSPLTATPASDWATTLAVATYFTPTAHGTGTETTLAIAYAGATFTGSISGTTLTTSLTNGTIATGMTIQGIADQGAAVLPGTMITGGSGTSWTVNNSQTVATQAMVGGVDLTAPVTYEATVDSGTGFTLDATLVLYQNWKTWVQGYGIQRMCAYEGGYSPDLSAGGNSSADRLRNASKLVPALQTHTLRMLNDFVGCSDGTFTAEFPSLYLLSSNPHSSGYVQAVWSVLDDIYQSPVSPQWAATMAFNAAHRRSVVRGHERGNRARTENAAFAD